MDGVHMVISADDGSLPAATVEDKKAMLKQRQLFEMHSYYKYIKNHTNHTQFIPITFEQAKALRLHLQGRLYNEEENQDHNKDNTNDTDLAMESDIDPNHARSMSQPGPFPFINNDKNNGKSISPKINKDKKARNHGKAMSVDSPQAAHVVSPISDVPSIEQVKDKMSLSGSLKNLVSKVKNMKPAKKTPIEEFETLKENIDKAINKFINQQNDILHENKEFDQDSKETEIGNGSSSNNNNNKNNNSNLKLFVRLSTRSPKDAVDKPPFRAKLMQLMAREFLIPKNEELIIAESNKNHELLSKNNKKKIAKEKEKAKALEEQNSSPIINKKSKTKNKFTFKKNNSTQDKDKKTKAKEECVDESKNDWHNDYYNELNMNYFDYNLRLIKLRECFSQLLCINDNYLDEIFNLLSYSERCVSDLIRLIENREYLPKNKWNLQLVLRSFNFIPIQNEFRCFVYNGKLTAITQYFPHCYFEDYSKNEIQIKIKQLIKYFLHTETNCNKNNGTFDKLHKIMTNYVLDLDVDVYNQSVNIIELNPFAQTTGAGFFNWKNERDSQILHGKYKFNKKKMDQDESKLEEKKEEKAAVGEEEEESALQLEKKREEMERNKKEELDGYPVLRVRMKVDRHVKAVLSQWDPVFLQFEQQYELNMKKEQKKFEKYAKDNNIVINTKNNTRQGKNGCIIL